MGRALLITCKVISVKFWDAAPELGCSIRVYTTGCCHNN